MANSWTFDGARRPSGTVTGKQTFPPVVSETLVASQVTPKAVGVVPEIADGVAPATLL